MRKKLLLLGLIIPTGLYAQVFEQEVYPVSNPGDVTLRESIVTSNHANTTYCSAGFYYYNQGSGGYYRPVLYNRNSNGVTNFENSYIMKGASSGTYNAKSYAVAEDSVSGYITAGVINDYGGNSVPGGGDILLLKYDANGILTQSKRIDFGYNEIAYDIIKKDNNYNKFIICGQAKRTTGSEVFIAEIDRNLNVTWVTRMALKISSTQPDASLVSVTVDGSGNIWAVGSIGTFTNSDYLLVKLNSSGTYQYAERFYATSRGEAINDISVAASGKLLLTGQSTTFFPTPAKLSLLVAQYDPATRTLSKTKFLRSKIGNAFKNNIGYEIIETTNPSNSAISYYVAGSSSATSDNIKDGLIYCLDANFSAQWQVYFESSDHVELYDVDFINDSGNGRLNFSGYFGITANYKEGYDVKTDMNGYSGCSESTSKDTLVTTLSIDTLVDSVYTTYNTHVVDTTFAYLADSTSCYDSYSSSGNNNQRGATITANDDLFPNPIKVGEELNFFNEENAGWISVYTLTGQIVYNVFYEYSGVIRIPLIGFKSGVYIVTNSRIDGTPISTQKLIITE